jgi:DMSO/TMAO reductase YedYZ molybdopterin-dependent catalytic subunit
LRPGYPGFFVGWARLAGPTLTSVLALFGPKRAAARVILLSVNGYSFQFSLEEALAEQNFLAYE